MIAELIILCNRIFRRAGRRPILIRFIRAPFLVDLLHFRDDPLLRNCIILNPHWATGAVYLILFDNTVIEAGGEFDAKDIERLWQTKEYKFNHADLLQLMLNFELCYEIKESGKYIVPELLPEQTPTQGYPEGLKALTNKEILCFEYWYHFMPKGIISRLIVRMNPSINILFFHAIQGKIYRATNFFLALLTKIFYNLIWIMEFIQMMNSLKGQ